MEELRICKGDFINQRSVNKIIIPEGVTEIGDEAFCGFNELQSVVFPTTLKSIRKNAFKHCSSIKSISIPASVESIGDGAFAYMTSLEHIEVDKDNPKFITYDNLSLIDKDRLNIVQYAIGSQSDSYTIPPLPAPREKHKEYDRGRGRIGELAFAGARYLKELSLDTTITHLEKTCFDNCDALKTMHVNYHPESKYVGFRINKCSNIEEAEDKDTEWDEETRDYYYRAISLPFEELHIGDGIEHLETRAFSGFKRLHTVELPKSLKGISHDSFSDSDNLKELFIPKSVNNIVNNVFSKQTILKFENGLEIKGSDLGNYGEERGYHRDGKEEENPPKVYRLDNEAICEYDKIIIKVSNEYIKTAIENWDDIYYDPNLIINYLLLLKIFNKDIKLLRDGKYICALRDERIPTLDISKAFSHNQTKPEIFENPEVAVNTIIKRYDAKGISLLEENKDKIDSSLAASFIKYFDENINMMVNDSLDQGKKDGHFWLFNNRAKLPAANRYNLEHLLDLANFLGAFQPDENIRRTAISFLRDKILSQKDGSFGVVSNDISEMFGKFYPKNEFNSELANLFMENCNRILKFAPREAKFYLLILVDMLVDVEKRKNSGKTETDIFLPSKFGEINDYASALFSQCIDGNMKRMLHLSKIMDQPGTAITNIKDLLNLARILGGFDKNAIVRQRALTFINDKILDAKNEKDRIVGDDIHRLLEELRPREEFDPEFARVFMANYETILDKENTFPGFIARTYNNFPDISRTSTSDSGQQRHLLVTFDKICQYLGENDFEGVTEETEELAEFLGYWFNENQNFQDGITITKEAEAAPRNIFTTFTTNRKGEMTFDDDSKNDLKESISENYSFEWLPKQELTNLILGKYCNCCAHVNGAGAGIMRASMISPNHQNMIIRNENGKIIAKSTMYVNREKGYAVFNNVEASTKYREPECLENIYNTFVRGATAFYYAYNKNNPDNPLTCITIGGARNTIGELLAAKEDIHPENEILEVPKYGEYALHEENGQYGGDSSSSQRLVLRKVS